MADRDAALAEFQAITGNENLDECIVILEQHDWNLMEAVQNALTSTDPDPEPMVSHPMVQPMFGSLPEFNPTQEAPLPVGFPLDEVQAGVFPLDEAVVGQSINSLNAQRISNIDIPPSGAAAASSTFSIEPAFQPFSASTARMGISQPSRFVSFKIEYRERTIELSLPDTSKVVKLKELLEGELNIPVSKQDLCGWVHTHDKKVSDEDTLADLHLPKENVLFLLTPELSTSQTNAKNGDDNSQFERLSQRFTLRIHYKDKEKVFTVNYPGSKTIHEVKCDVYSMIDVPVRRQVWEGWPGSVDEDTTMTLAGSGISFPCHNLNVSTSKHNSKSTKVTTKSREDADQSDDDMEMDSDDDFEDAHDHFSIDDNFLDPEIPGPRKPEPLMPDNASNEVIALNCFSTEFASRFGDCHPVFYVGSLEDALKEALHCRARDRKLLAIYLHHDSSILANVFCSQILCAESIVSLLTSNFIIWAWDLTSDSNKARLLTMCTRHFGSLAAGTVRNIRPDELPLLLLISRSRGSNEVVNAIRGNTTLDEMMSQLLGAHETFREQLHAEIQEEDERDARERVKQEQDEAYQQSLAADRAKSQAKQAETEENQRRQNQEIELQHAELEKKQLEEATKEAVRISIANELPDAPPANCNEPCTTIRFRCPDGRNVVRRFFASNTLQIPLQCQLYTLLQQTLLNYVISEGYHLTEYKVLTTFPRRDLTVLDCSATLDSLKMVPQETVILEEK